VVQAIFAEHRRRGFGAKGGEEEEEGEVVLHEEAGT